MKGQGRAKGKFALVLPFALVGRGLGQRAAALYVRLPFALPYRVLLEDEK
jgi:hypothetical protein